VIITQSIPEVTWRERGKGSRGYREEKRNEENKGHTHTHTHTHTQKERERILTTKLQMK
jgi:hypothetical protein